MNRIIHLSLALLVFSLVSHGHHDVDHHHDHHDPKAAIKIQSNVVEFAFEFYKTLAARSHGENIVFSPCSISILLSVLLLGTNSNTHAEILKGLDFNMTKIQEDEIHQGFHELLHLITHSEEDYKVDIGQGLFLKEGIQPLQTFLDKIKEFYEAEIQATKFQDPKEAEKQINDYIKEKTHGKIAELVKDLNPETVFVVTNYIFFRGHWKNPFNPEFTREEDFFVDHNTTVKVQMMHRTGWFYSYFDSQLSCTVLQIDYNGTETTFFVLPDPKKEKELDASLSIETVNRWAQNVQRNTATVSIPKFSISATYNLKEPLSQLGITEIFTDDADLSRVTGGRALKLSKNIVANIQPSSISHSSIFHSSRVAHFISSLIFKRNKDEEVSMLISPRFSLAAWTTLRLRSLSLCFRKLFKNVKLRKTKSYVAWKEIVIRKSFFKKKRRKTFFLKECIFSQIALGRFTS